MESPRPGPARSYIIDLWRTVAPPAHVRCELQTESRADHGIL